MLMANRNRYFPGRGSGPTGPETFGESRDAILVPESLFWRGGVHLFGTGKPFFSSGYLSCERTRLFKEFCMGIAQVAAARNARDKTFLVVFLN